MTPQGPSTNPSTASSATPPEFAHILMEVRNRVAETNVFRSAGVHPSPRHGPMLICPVLASAEPAEYRVFIDAGRVWIALVTAARWLSQSIEADLVHTGDKMEDLIEEELIDHGVEGLRLTVEHFRDDDKLFTFRSALPATYLPPAAINTPAAADRITPCLLAYESAFRPLGDMEVDPDD